MARGVRGAIAWRERVRGRAVKSRRDSICEVVSRVTWVSERVRFTVDVVEVE